MSAKPLPTALLALDLCASAVPVAGLLGAFGPSGDPLLLSAVHLSALAVAGLVVQARRKGGADGGGDISGGWLLPSYLANVVGILCLFMPLCQMLDSLRRRLPEYFAGEFLVFADIILLVAGTPKWTRLVMGARGIPRALRLIYCAANPLRAAAAMLGLFALTVPVI